VSYGQLFFYSGYRGWGRILNSGLQMRDRLLIDGECNALYHFDFSSDSEDPISAKTA
jgi:hypothetical protein